MGAASAGAVGEICQSDAGISTLGGGLDAGGHGGGGGSEDGSFNRMIREIKGEPEHRGAKLKGLNEAVQLSTPLNLDYSIKVFDQTAGFSDYALGSVAVTGDGCLWYCSFEGVGRFDGTQFVDLSTPTNSPLAGIRPRKMFVDRAGRLWVGAASRIYCHETNAWRSFGVEQGVPNELIRMFAEDAAGVLWAASGSSVVRRVGEQFENVPALADSRDEVYYLAAERGGRVWGAGGETLGCIEQGRGTHAMEVVQTFTNKIRGLLPARSGGVWVAFEREIKLRQGDVWTKVRPRPERIWGDDVEMLEDSRGNLWVGGWRSGLVVYSPTGSVRQATTREGLANDSVSGIVEDREGNIWISSNGGGLVRLRPLAFRSYGRESGLVQIANSVSEAGPGRMWIGTHGDGIALLENGQVTSQSFWPETNFMAGVWVHGVLQDRGGDTWAATYSPGLLRLHEGAWSRIPIKDTGSRVILSLFEDREGRLWVGTDAGLAVRENGTFTVCSTHSGLPAMAVGGIGQDGAGDIWVGGPGGELFRGHAGRFTRFSAPGMVANARFQALTGGRDGSLWAAFSGGWLARMQGEKIWVYGEDQGMPVMDFSALVEDDQGDLWVSGSKGVGRLGRASLEAVALGTGHRAECQMFDQHDGLPGPVRSGFQPVCWKASDGRIWFATVRGVAVVDPKGVLPKLGPPSVKIVKMLVEGRPLAGWETSVNPLRLPATSRQLDIHYSVVRLGTPERLRFQRRLQPEESWEDAGRERRADLHSLIPGRYRFEVRAADVDDVWGPSVVLGFEVQPFYWQTDWFRALIVLSLAGGAGIAVALFLRIRQQRQLETIARQASFTQNLIKAQDAERQRIALELHDGLGQGLLVIANLAGFAQRPGKSAEAVLDELREISTTTKGMLEELRDLSRSLRPQLLDSLGLTRALQALMDQTARTELRVVSDLENVDALFPTPGNMNLYRIVQEAIANVFKHASATRVQVILRTDATVVRLSVEDDGCGFAVGGTSDQPVREGAAGLGLLSMTERARLLGGSLWVESQPGMGTRLIVEIPLKT